MIGGAFGPRPKSQTAPQGVRLSELVPPHAVRGVEPGHYYRPSGGPGGIKDPWKALSVRWDYGSPPSWPPKVSPWEVRPRTLYRKGITNKL
jgi:hypothetical protein